jgi:hypothetical protein
MLEAMARIWTITSALRPSHPPFFQRHVFSIKRKGLAGTTTTTTA